MTDIINILPDSVANQIAAGEVVDRPASCVKELLENAIDAGARRIQLIVKDAGRTLIQVIDDGKGMSTTDARLCFERHATSKIHSADDLFAIRTMGFRGEALASIAAVAQVELRTRQAGAELGTQVIIEGSMVKSQGPCSCGEGTAISVKNLFFNIPARRNFLKKDSIELSHIDEVFRRVVLVNNEIEFTFHANGRLLYDLRAGNKAQRITAVFGMHGTEKLFPVQEQTDVVSVEGFIGKPEYARKTRGEQYLFCNNRYIKHQRLANAVESAYRELIPEHTYPSYFLFITIDPSRLDVNIHPTKTEVRFVDEHAVLSILRAATRKSLGQFRLATEIDFNPSSELDLSPAPKGYIPPVPTVSYREDYDPFAVSGPQAAAPTARAGFDRLSWGNQHTQQDEGWADYRGRYVATTDTLASSAATAAPTQPAEQQQTVLFADGDDMETDVGEQPQMPIAYGGRYIITSLRSGVVVIDYRRAEERIVFEQLLSRSRHTSAAGSQQLLFPLTCTFGPADSALIDEAVTLMDDMGFVTEHADGASLVVRAVPPCVRESDVKDIADCLVAGLRETQIQPEGGYLEVACATTARQVACHAVFPADAQAMNAVIGSLFACSAPTLTPSGKPTLITINEACLDQAFDRI